MAAATAVRMVLHRLIDELPEEKLTAARRYLEDLRLDGDQSASQERRDPTPQMWVDPDAAPSPVPPPDEATDAMVKVIEEAVTREARRLQDMVAESLAAREEDPDAAPSLVLLMDVLEDLLIREQLHLHRIVGQRLLNPPEDELLNARNLELTERERADLVTADTALILHPAAISLGFWAALLEPPGRSSRAQRGGLAARVQPVSAVSGAIGVGLIGAALAGPVGAAIGMALGAFAGYIVHHRAAAEAA